MEVIMTYVQPFFGWLLQTTLIASVVICLILAAQKTLGGKLGPRWCNALWLVLVIRMVLPWAPSSRISLLNLIPSWDRHIQRQQLSEATEQQDVSRPAQTAGTSEAMPGQKPQSEIAIQERVAPQPRTLADVQSESKPQLVSVRRVLPLLWLAGAMVIGAYLLVSDLALWRIVKRDCPLVNQSMLELFEECKAQMGVQSLVMVVPSSQVRSPGLFGFIRPRLLLPREMLDTATREEMRYVFLHELAHLKRRDIYLGWLTSLLQVLHWFNPVIWFAFYQMRSDRELACDALVLTRTGQEKSQEYGGAIVGLLRRFSHSRPLPAMAGIIESKSQLKRRIAMITQFRNNSYRWSPLAFILIVILACVSLSDANRTVTSETSAAKPTHKPNFRKIRIPAMPKNGVLSPDGNKLAFMSDDAVWVVPLHGKVHPDIAGEPVRLAELKGIWEASGMMAWSADGKWIAVYGRERGRGSVCVIPVAGGKPRVVQLPKQGSSLSSYRLSLSPDGQILAFSALELGTRHEVPGSPDRYIYTIPTAGGEPKQVSSDWARMPSFSSDGEFIAYVGYRKREAWQRNTGIPRFHGDLWVVPSAGGTPVKLASVDGRLRGPVWSPDGKYIAAHHEPGGSNDSKEIWVFPLSPDASSAGEPEKIALPHSSWRNNLAGWTPEGQLGVFLAPEAHCAIYTVPASGGKAMQITLTDGPNYPRWSPDGERIYVRGRFDKEDKVPILYVPSEGGDPVQVPPVQLERRLVSRVPNGGHNVSPDGKRIVISTSNGIWTIPLDGGLPTRLTSGESFEGLYPCWSPNGRTIAFTEWNSKYENEVFYTIYVIPADGGEISQITSEADRVGGGAIAFSPDGERIAFFSGGAIKTIPIEGGQRQVLVTDVKSGQYNIFRQLAYSPDGSKIAHNAGAKIWITSLGGGEPEELRTGLPENARLIDFGWSPDGEKIAFIALIGGEEEFWLIENFLPKSTTGE